MSRVLVDTSVWIGYFRSGEGALYDLLDEELERGEVVTCGVVLTELLRGVRGKKEERILSEVFQAIPYVEIDRKDWEDAGRLLAGGRIRASRVPSTDGLLAQVCIRHGLRILTLDKHFDLFEKIPKVRVG